MLSRRAKRSLAVVLMLVGVPFGALALGCLVPGASPEMAGDGGAEIGQSHEILVIAGPIHTDIALPATPQVRERFAFLKASDLPVDRPDVEWIVAGRGGRSFYLETPTFADIRPIPLLKSFTADDAAMHVTLAGAIAPDPASIRSFTLDGPRFEALLAFIERSFRHDPAGVPMAIAGAGYGRFDRFYEGEGWFNAIVGCNVWTASALRVSGIGTGIWTPLPTSLFRSIELHN